MTIVRVSSRSARLCHRRLGDLRERRQSICLKTERAGQLKVVVGTNNMGFERPRCGSGPNTVGGAAGCRDDGNGFAAGQPDPVRLYSHTGSQCGPGCKVI
jgi:hypothetical protein